MLANVKEALKELYFDSTFHGMDFDARFKEAERQITEATSTWQINAIIAQTLLELDDSHTRFSPPDLVVGLSFGFQMQMVGDVCYVVGVKPKSNAEGKGLMVGDVVYAIEGYEPTRNSLWKIMYSHFVLMPPPSLRVTVRKPDGRLHELVIEATISNKKPNVVEPRKGAEKPPQYHNLSDEVIICKLHRFDLNDKEVSEMMKRIKPYKVLILDLRGNRGGRVSTEQRLLGYFFDKDVKICDEQRRKKTSARMAQTRGPDKVYHGKVYVLVNSGTASAAEVFARVMQLEKRGTVVGDRTSGAVRTGVGVIFALKTAPNAPPSNYFYGVNITVADVIMSDGKSLEKVGVLPDIGVLPKGEDLLSKRDPVLAHAASLVGVTLDARNAGKIFSTLPADDEADEDAKPKP